MTTKKLNFGGSLGTVAGAPAPVKAMGTIEIAASIDDATAKRTVLDELTALAQAPGFDFFGASSGDAALNAALAGRAGKKLGVDVKVVSLTLSI